MENVLVFDLETQYLAAEVGGWGRIRDMRLSVGVTYDVATGTYHTYTEDQAEDLVLALREADLVVGYNLLRFDYEVLRAYTHDPLGDLPTVDMLRDLYRVLGWRPRLDSVARATLGETKSADGLQAVTWFRDGEIARLIDYCKRDVEITWRVYEYGRRHAHVLCYDRNWRTLTISVAW